jgi:hypothetical protein
MERIKNWIIATMFVAILALGLLLTDAGHAAAAAMFQVVFTNAAGLSVGNTVQLDPAANTVKVANFPATQAVDVTFPATQAVSGSVNVNNFPQTQTVTLGNATLPVTAPSGGLPVSIQNDAAGAVQLYAFPLEAGGKIMEALKLQTSTQTYSVTPGKTLVLESISASIVLAHGDLPLQVTLYDTTGVSVNLVPTLVGSFQGVDFYVSHSEGRAYFTSVDAGVSNELTLLVYTNGSGSVTGVPSNVYAFGREVPAN